MLTDAYGRETKYINAAEVGRMLDVTTWSHAFEHVSNIFITKQNGEYCVCFAASNSEINFGNDRAKAIARFLAIIKTFNYSHIPPAGSHAKGFLIMLKNCGRNHGKG